MLLPVDSLDTVFCGSQLRILNNPLIKNKQKDPNKTENQPTHQKQSKSCTSVNVNFWGSSAYVRVSLTWSYKLLETMNGLKFNRKSVRFPCISRIDAIGMQGNLFRSCPWKTEVVEKSPRFIMYAFLLE